MKIAFHWLLIKENLPGVEPYQDPAYRPRGFLGKMTSFPAWRRELESPQEPLTKGIRTRPLSECDEIDTISRAPWVLNALHNHLNTSSSAPINTFPDMFPR